MFIVIEGMDGSGKGLQTERLLEFLQHHQRQVRRVYDPGTTQLGQSIRQILLHQLDQKLSTKMETLLFMTARASLDEEITELRNKQCDVVSDRWLASTLVYQVLAAFESNKQTQPLVRVHRLAEDWLQNKPDLTIILDVPAEVAMARRAAQKERVDAPKDRFETRGLEWWQKLCQGYRDLNRNVLLENTVLIDGDQDPAIVQNLILLACRSRIPEFDALTPE